MNCSIVSNLNGHPNLIGYVDSTISLLDGGVQRVVAPVVHGREVHAVLQQHGADRRQVVLS